MATKLFPPADLQRGPNDLPLTSLQFLTLPRFSNLRKKPKDTSLQSAVRKVQGAMVVRGYRTHDCICREGDAGVTAFYILSLADVYGLFAYADKKLKEAEVSSTQSDRLSQYLQSARETRDAYRDRLETLKDPQQLP